MTVCSINSASTGVVTVRTTTATIKDVALAASVSPATVSLVLNDVSDSRIPEHTAQRVRAAAHALGYAPNSLARGLRRRRSDTIALISDDVASTPFSVRMIEAVHEVAHDNGLLLFLIHTGGDPEEEAAAATTLRRQQVDGVLYASMHHRIVDLPPALGARTVLLDARTTKASFPAVVPDERAGAYAAVTELVEHGHRRIGFIDDFYASEASRLRLLGYRDALKAAGIRYERRLVVYAEPGLKSSAQAAVRLYEEAGFTGLFCFNDRVAVGAGQGLRAHGLAVPRDVSIVGFDDQDFVAAYAEPPLTTVALPHFQMGLWAARTLIDLVNGEVVAPKTHLMECTLVRRDSVGPPPASGTTPGK
jgi:LacI family transcriptional regulator